MTSPLITIAIPTYNRAALLPRAIESALAQDHDNLEIIISDNASTDDTRAIGEDRSRRFATVRYERLPTNRGPVANFLHALRISRGDYFMWLGDDDWIDASYARRCLEELLRDPSASIVGGAPLYYEGDRFLFKSRSMTLAQRNPSDRVVAYYRDVSDNGLFYGLAARTMWLRADWRNTFGGDWLYLASLVFLGKALTIEDTRVHREYTWNPTSGARRIAKQSFLPSWQSRYPYLSITKSAIEDVLYANPVFRPLGAVGRIGLAQRCARVLLRRFGLRPATS